VHVSPALAWHNYTAAAAACTESVIFCDCCMTETYGGPITQLFDAPRASI
jgi:hypothetical protein